MQNAVLDVAFVDAAADVVADLPSDICAVQPIMLPTALVAVVVVAEAVVAETLQ